MKEKDLGIGLYQCNQIVESHGGRIEVASEAGRGTTYRRDAEDAEKNFMKLSKTRNMIS